eukprot:TRINITY_DN34844_c1_g1_i1.p1 TRINITY_DN34844_c1_g1~~TRINITY_DN34844_c1_g1_i1.p1  ORF type:complete len:443 (+),score=171.63 TRINITY_DN34844_c1_g1_i1:98-1426(+)
MGNSSPYTSPQIPLKEGTTLVEIEIASLDDASAVSGMKPEGYTPLVLVPQDTFSFMRRIPAGFNAIVTAFDADKGVYAPGFYCMPPWMRVSYLVSKQLTVFDTPVKDCKTADNVTVNIDVLIVFEITDATKFVYNLGPDKLDGLMRAAQEEALRGMASSVTHDKVFELQGMDTASLVEEMNQKFDAYGVLVHHFTVKNVRLPVDLMQTMESKTIYISKESQQKMKQELEVLQMDNKSKLVKIQEESEVEQQNATQEAVTAEARIQQEVAGVVSSKEKDIARIDAEKDAQVQQVLSEAEIEVTQLRNQRDQVAREVKAETEKEVIDIMTEAWKYRREKNMQLQSENAANYAQASSVVVEAEMQADDTLGSKRAHEEEKAKLEVYRQVANNSGIRVATSAEVGARGLNLRDDAVGQVAHAALRYARAKFSEFGEGSDPLLGKKK